MYGVVVVVVYGRYREFLVLFYQILSLISIHGIIFETRDQQQKINVS